MKKKSSSPSMFVFRSSAFLIFLFIIAMLPVSATADEKTNTGDTKPPPDSIKFLDSDNFDESLSALLNKKGPDITVNFYKAPNVNNMPKRLDKWLYNVEKFNGKIVVMPEPDGKKFIGALIELVIGAYKLAKATIIYSPSKYYNATVYFDRSTGNLTRVVFAMKKESGKKGLTRY